MSFFSYKLLEKRTEIDGIYILRLQPVDKPIPHFLAGQHISMTNPLYAKPHEEHIFSPASSPEDPVIEFCIREYGFWTQALNSLKKGDILNISEARGSFTFDQEIKHAVFLCGGVGISPLISILRNLEQKSLRPDIKLLYGSRTKETIAYKDELERLEKALPLTVIHIFSDEKPNESFQGYHGFITDEIIQKEVSDPQDKDWFITGPEIFVGKMIQILTYLGVPDALIHTEEK